MRLTEIIERSRMIDKNGKKILSINFSELQIEQTCQIIDHSTQLLQKMSEKSVYTLTNVTGANFNLELIDKLKKFSQANIPYVIAGAVIGADGIKHTVLNSVLLFSGRRDLKTFITEEEALSWILAL